MRAEGQGYGIATDSIGAIGGSAGGHLVAPPGTSFQAAALEGNGGHAGVSSRVQAVVALAPVTDFATMSGTDTAGSTVAQVLFQNKIELARTFSPVTYLSKGSAPVLLMHGGADKTVPISQSEEMLERCRKAGVRASLITVKDAPHPFWNLAKWAPDTIAQAAAFFHDVLGD